MTKKSSKKITAKKTTEKKTIQKIPSIKQQRRQNWDSRIRKGSNPTDIQIFKIEKQGGTTIYTDHQVYEAPNKQSNKPKLKHHGIKIAADVNLEKEGLEFSEKGLFDKITNEKIGRLSRKKRRAL